MALKKFSDNAISSLNDDWGKDPKDGNLPFSGQAVQDFIKSQLGEKVGYASTEIDTTLDKTFIYFFQSQATYEEWVEDKVGKADNIKFSCELPTGGGNQTLDVYSVSLEKPEDQELEIVTTNSNVYLRIRANSKVKRGGSNETVQLKETGTLTISTAAGTSNAFTKRRSMSLSSIDNEDDTNNYTTIDVSDYITKDATVKIRLAWKGSESQLTRTITFIVDQSTFGLSFATEYEYPFKSTTDTILNFATTGSIAKTLYVKINGFKTNEDHLSIGDQIYTHKSSGPLTGNVTEAINIGKVSNGIYNGTYWICTDSIKSEEKSFQFVVSDEDSGMQLIVNNINNSISNWSLNDIFDYAFCGAPTSNLKFIFWSTDLTKTYAEISESSVTPKAKHTLKLQTEFDVDTDITNLDVIVRVYEDKGTTITNTTPPVSEVRIKVDTTENFAPTSMASGFILDPKSRSNASSDRETIYNALNNTVVTNDASAWVNMDWLNGGWTSDETGNKCLRMLAGSKVTIPFKVFDASDAGNTLRYGVTIEVDFAFRNVSNDTEPVVNMSTKLTRTQPYGMVMYPNVAYIYTNSLIDTLNQDTEYQEDTRIHFTANVKYGHTLTVNGRNYSGNIIRTYINGTVNREFMYESSDSFHVNTENIVIGSDYADVDIYGIRIYENQTLDTVQIQNDYISALPSFADKKAYKAANAICNNDGTINYDLAKNKYRTIKFTGRYPYYMNQSSSEGTLTVTYLRDTLDEYGNYEVDTDNSCIITNMSCKGQGSTSKQYYKWNGSWSFKDSSVYKDINGNVINDHAYFQVVKRDEDDNIVAVTPRATKLVGKLNYASSMQSHKQGSLNMYEDLRNRFGYKTEIQNIGGSDDQGDAYYKQRFDLSRLALREDEFLFFVEEDGETRFYGLMTWGAAKGDKLTYGYDKKTEGSKDMLMVGGSTQTNPLTLCHAPWITDDVKVSTDDEGSIETWTYNGSNAYDNELGNTNSIVYLRDYMNFIYECSYRLKYYDGSVQSMNDNLTSVDDRTYQYWTQDFEVYRYDYIHDEWVSAGVYIYNDDVDYTKSTTAKTSLNLITSLNGITVVAPDGREVAVNASIKDLGYSYEDLNTIFKRARAKKLRNNISNYVNPNEILFCFAFTLFIAASDNLAKNSYFMVDKKASGSTRPKIHPWRDDDDTIFRINNEGTKDKNYWVEFFSKKENGNPYFTANNTAYYGTLLYAYLIDLEERDAITTPSLRSIMNAMIGHMASLGSGYEINGDPVLGCFNRYYFSIQKYFPSVAYNETARLLYEEAELRMRAGEEVLDPSKNDRPITMSMGDSLQGEMQFMKMRTFFMKTFAMYYNGLSKFGYKLDDQKTLGDDLDVTVEAGAHMYLFSMNTEKSTKQNHPILKDPGETHTFRLDAGQTVTASVVGTEYLSSVGDWSNKKTYDGKSSINIVSNRTTKFKGGDEIASNVKFDANTIGSFPSIIEEIDLRNVKNLQGVGNFARYTRLKKLLLEGTNLNTVELPMTNALTEVSVPNVIEAITVRQAPNFDDHSLMLEEKDHLKTITIYSDGETGYYGTNFEWVRKWLSYLSSEVIKETECKLKMEGIKWTLTNDECKELAKIRTEINSLDIKGTIICDPDSFTSDTINIIKAAFGDDAFNPSNPLRFVVAIPYSEILYSSTTNDEVTNGSLKEETNNGSDVIQGWSNNYTLYTINYDIIKVTWSVTQNDKLTLSNQTDEGVTVTCSNDVNANKEATLTASIDVYTEDHTSVITVKVEKVLQIKKRTYPIESECTISDNGILTEYHKEYVYNLGFNQKFYTGNYTITWAIGDLVNGVFTEHATVARITSTSIDGMSCTVYTEANPEQAEETTLRVLINCEDGTEVIKYKAIFVGQKFMAQFGDVYLSNGRFVRPIYTYNENGIVSGVTIPFAKDDIPIGVTIVPATHTIDGTARVMSLAEMSTTTPDTGSLTTREGINWGGYQQDITDLPNLTQVPNLSSSASTTDWSRLGSETNYNGKFRYHNSGETGDGLWYYSTSADTFSEGWNRACPSPFKGESPFEPDAELNPLYAKKGTATADYDGKGNTEKILAHMKDETWKTSETISKTSSIEPADSANWHPAAACCWRYSTPGTTQGQWYLPACGELGYIIPRMNTLNKILNAIPNANGGTSKALSLLTLNFYWSSSEYSSFYARYVYPGSGYVYYSDKYNYFYVRACLQA